MKHTILLINSIVALAHPLAGQLPTAPQPTEGMTLIAPPQPNPLGQAVLDYPLSIPPGRQGMQPDLAITYNSDNANSWLGLGWDLTLPAFTLDTRWGVPRYSDTHETESYLYDGQALFPMAHRGEVRERSAEAVFYPRIESAFERIVRHGDAPQNYWWEVTDKDGVRFYYGGTPTTGVLAAATLQTNSGQIAHWALVEVVDTDGNHIRYTYTKVAQPGNSGGQLGQELYPHSITYTGHNDTAGPFRIAFIRDRDLAEPQRPDTGIDLRLGFKRVLADCLRRVEVYYQNQLVRAYRLEYDLGAFDKTLLQRIVVENSQGAEFYEHRFTYYDDIRPAGTYAPYAAAENWNVPDDNILGSILNPIPGMNGETSAIGGAQSSNFNVGGAATVGANDLLLFSKDKTAGGTYAYGSSTDEGIIALVDINGDGLPDKVYRKNNVLRYRPNLAVSTGQAAFGDERPVHGMTQFSTSSTSSNSYGAEGNPPFSYVGFEYTNATSTNNTYFSDFNGDGLIDIAQNGQVWFNHLNADGDPTFTTDSGDTPSPIASGGALSDDLFVIDPAELETAIDQYPLQDVVRMWQAPLSGTLQLDATVQLAIPTDPMAATYPSDDGVRVAIQLNNTELWSAMIAADDPTPVIPNGIGNLQVQTGDRLYFRVQSIFDGANDQVNWSPTIDYVAFADTLGLSQRDANQKPISHYQAAEDFVLAARQQVGLPLNGTVRIQGTIAKPPVSDDLVAEILHWQNGISTILYRDTLAANEALSVPIDLEIAVEEQDALSFHLHSDTQLDWTALTWVPNVYYTASPDAAVTDANGDPIFSFCPTVDLSMYNHQWANANVQIATDSATYRFAPTLTFTPPGNLNDSRVTFSVKGAQILYKITFPINDLATAMPLLVPLQAGDTLFVEYHFEDWGMAQLADTLGFTWQDTASVQTPTLLAAGYASTIDTTLSIFGHLYRGWGQFEYNGNRDRANLPIQQAELVLEVPETDPDAEIPDDPDQLDGLFDPTTAPFLVMLPDAKTQCYLGYDNFTFVSATQVSSSRLGEDNLLPLPPASTDGSGLGAPNRTTKTNEYSIAGGIGVGVVTGTASKSWVDTEITMDVMDFNGDRYPDIVSRTAIQYTSDRGGYLPGLTPISFGHHAAKSEALGFTLGGSFVPSRTSNSGEPKGEGSNRRASKAKRRSGKLGKNAKNGGNTAGDAVGVNGTFSEDGDHALHSWADINGDGLVDKVRDDGHVALNYGYRFGPFEPWGFTHIQAGESVDYGGGLGISLYNGSIAAGISLTRTDNFTTQTLEDVNADGLPDAVSMGATPQVRLNTGAGFGNSIPWNGLPQIDEGSATGESVNAAFTVCIPVFFIKICINPSTAIGRGVSRQLRQLEDIDGDGFPDLLESASDGALRVQASTIGRTNLLRTVERPFGMTFTLEFAPTGNTSNQPFPTWTMTKVAIAQPATDDQSLTTFAYSNGLHHRHERAFYGFGTITTTDVDAATGTPYRRHTQQFANNTYYDQGLLVAETWETADGTILKSTEYAYQLRDAATGTILLPVQLGSSQLRVFPALVQQTERRMDDSGNTGLTATRTYDYNLSGNLTRHRDLGGGHPDEWLEMTFSYHALTDAHVLAVRDSVVVRDARGLVQLRTSEVNDTGDVLQIQHWVADNQTAVYDYEYDQYGNTTYIAHPANANGQRLTFAYTYDSTTHTYPISETDVYGLRRERRYDPRYGVMAYVKDEYGQEAHFEWDDYGRNVLALYPADALAGSDYSLRYGFATINGLPRLQTERYDPEWDTPFITYTFADETGKVIQEQALLEIASHADAAASLQLRTSGKAESDDFGRTTAYYYPSTAAAAVAGQYQTEPDPMPPTRLKYDALDRPVQLETPEGTVYDIQYNFAQTPSGVVGEQATTTNPLGHHQQQIFDTRGRLIASATAGPNGPIWVEYQYNPLDQIVAIHDADGQTTHYEYDGLGRMTRLEHPDGGVYEYAFDAAGNLLSQLTPAIRERDVPGAKITYHYSFDRLERIEYPFNPQNQVRYTWGDSTATAFRNGRVYLVEDASGAQELWYDGQGQVSKVVRTMIVNEIARPTFVSEYEYDSWGRLKKAYYPDGEKITYTFNKGGGILALTGEKAGRSYDYVRECRYDKFDDRIYIGYGNGTATIYPKTTDTNRYAGISTRLPTGAPAMQLSYMYDPLGRLTDWQDDTAPTAEGARRQSQTFQYDTANRLTAAQGRWDTPDNTFTYQLGLEYDDHYNIIEQHLQISEGQNPVIDYNLAYQYDGTRPHFPTQIGDAALTANPNGNQQARETPTAFRIAQYDEEGRLTALSDNGYLSRYAYDASGQRAIKSHAPGAGISLDATPLGNINHGNANYTLYVSPFLEITNDSFHKHYYLDERCIASKKGTGYFISQLLPPAQQITAGNLDLSDRLRRLRELLLQYTEDLGVPPGHPSLPFYYIDAGEAAAVLPQLDASSPRLTPPPGWPTPHGPPDSSGPPGHPVWYAEPASPESAVAGYGYNNPLRTPEVALSYYHYSPFGDVLQVSNTEGRLFQQWGYLPTGGSFVSERLADGAAHCQTYRNHRLDTESGLHYSGDAYYDTGDALWLNFSAQSDATPYRSPYLLAAGQGFASSDVVEIQELLDGLHTQSTDAVATIAQVLASGGGSLSVGSFTLAGGPQAGAVEIAAAEAQPKGDAKNGAKPNVKTTAAKSQKGIVGNISLRALRRQFLNRQDTPAPVSPDENTPADAATKKAYRNFTIAPGDWDGIQVPGNRYFQFKPSPDAPATRKHKRVAAPHRVRFRVD